LQGSLKPVNLLNQMSKNYFFVDESGDPTFFNKKKELIVGNNGCSNILILGFVKTQNPRPLRKAISELHSKIISDPYLQSIPSLEKTKKCGFHAKDDCPEVRAEVYKLLKTLDFKVEFVVARKRLDVFKKRHNKDENLFYMDIFHHLFKNQLHKEDAVIYFSKRGSQTRQYHIEKALNLAIEAFQNKNKQAIHTKAEVLVQIPTEEPNLMLVDYMNWALSRAYTKGEMRYFEFLKEKISLVWDIYDFEKYDKPYKENNFYTKKQNPFCITKISPLELGDESRTA